MKRLFFVILILLLTSQAGYSQSGPTLIELLHKADSLKSIFHEKQALDTYLQVLEIDSTNFHAVWNASYYYSRVGNRFSDKNQKRDYFQKAKSLAERALRLEPDNTYSNFVMAVAMGRIALVASARDRVAASNDIKHYVDKSISEDSSLADAWYVLGRWNYKVDNLNFAERFAANVIFGGLPKGASTEKAIDDYNKAISLKPDVIMFYHSLAIAYHTAGQDQKAIETINKLLTLKDQSPDDPMYKDESKKLLNKIK